MNYPLISILIPAYNCDNYIGDCLESVINQNYDNLEIICVNDGSTDRTPEILNFYASKYRKITLVQQENKGVASARNRLLKEAKGEYILFVDSDDTIENNCVSSLISTVVDNDVPMVIYNVDYPGDEDYAIYNKSEIVCEFIRHQLINGMLWNKLIRRSVTSGVTFDSTISYGEDALFIWQIIQRCERVALLRRNFYHHRIHSSSLSASKFDEKKISSHWVWNKIYDDTLSLWPQFAETAKANYAVCDLWLIYFAAKDCYPFDDKIRSFQHHLREELPNILRLKLLSRKMSLFAGLAAYNYYLSSILLKFMRLK